MTFSNSLQYTKRRVFHSALQRALDELDDDIKVGLKYCPHPDVKQALICVGFDRFNQIGESNFDIDLIVYMPKDYPDRAPIVQATPSSYLHNTDSLQIDANGFISTKLLSNWDVARRPLTRVVNDLLVILEEEYSFKRIGKSTYPNPQILYHCLFII